MDEPKISKFFELFCGEYVMIIINKEAEETIQTETKIKSTKHPLVVTGYIIEEDDEYLFLGHDPQLISQAIKKSYIIHIEITDERDADAELLNEIVDVPKSDKGYN